jgi:hypothetical protein
VGAIFEPGDTGTRSRLRNPQRSRRGP